MRSSKKFHQLKSHLIAQDLSMQDSEAKNFFYTDMTMTPRPLISHYSMVSSSRTFSSFVLGSRLSVEADPRLQALFFLTASTRKHSSRKGREFLDRGAGRQESFWWVDATGISKRSLGEHPHILVPLQQFFVFFFLIFYSLFRFANATKRRRRRNLSLWQSSGFVVFFT